MFCLIVGALYYLCSGHGDYEWDLCFPPCFLFSKWSVLTCRKGGLCVYVCHVCFFLPFFLPLFFVFCFFFFGIGFINPNSFFKILHCEKM